MKIYVVLKYRYIYSITAYYILHYTVADTEITEKGDSGLQASLRYHY